LQEANAFIVAQDHSVLKIFTDMFLLFNEMAPDIIKQCDDEQLEWRRYTIGTDGDESYSVKSIHQGYNWSDVRWIEDERGELLMQNQVRIRL
jgi:hypothetical protein